MYEAEKEFLPEESGNDVTICPRCHLDQVTCSNLMSHVKKFHKDIYNFLCKKCDKGFMSKAGLNMHKATHKGTKIPCEVEGCETKCSTVKSLKQHMRIFHPKGEERNGYVHLETVINNFRPSPTGNNTRNPARRILAGLS